MRVIIAGSRSITDYGIVEQAVKNSGFEITEVVSGGARGVDKLGEYWAMQHNVPFVRFEAKWDQHGRAAGHIRNGEMALYASQGPIGGAVIAIWDGVSRGTNDMITRGGNKGLKVYVEKT